MKRLGKLPPVITGLEQFLAWLEMMPCPSFAGGVMLPKIVLVSMFTEAGIAS
jgi:hypothetical protein